MASPAVAITISANGVDGVRRQLQLVKNDVADVAKSTEGLSHSSLIGFSELARGIAKTAEAGQVGAFAMREFTGAAFRLGAALGPEGAIIPLLGTLGFALYEVFHKPQAEMDKLAEKWKQTLDDMVNAGNNAALMKQAKDLIMGTPADYFQDSLANKQKQLAEQQGVLQGIIAQGGGLNDKGLLANPFAPKSLVDSFNAQQAIVKKWQDDIQLTTTHIDQLKEAILAVNNTPIELRGLDAMRITAERDGGRVGSIPEIGYKTDDRESYYASLFGQYRAGLMGDQYNPNPGGLGKDKSIFTGGQITGLKIKAAQIPPNLFEDAQIEIAKQWAKMNEELSLAMANGIAGTFTNVLSDAFTGSFGQIGKDALGGLGTILEQMGSILIKFGIGMEGLDAALTNPFTSGIAAITVGVLLEALGKTLGSTAHSSGGGGAGLSAGSVSSSASSLNGQGSVTIVLPKGGSFLDPNNPELMDDFANVMRKAFGNRQVTIQEFGG